jgi:protein-disulfide isomerase
MDPSTPSRSSSSPLDGTWQVRPQITRRLWLGVAVTLALLGAVGAARASDLTEIKETQKKILERLDAQDKVLKDILQKLQAPPQGAARPQIDPNKVYTIALGGSPIRGPKAAPVTMVEFSDYQ